MRVLFAGGGTGGHLFAALAVAEELRRRAAHEILFVGTDRGLEARAVPAAGFELRTVHAKALKGIRLGRQLAHLLLLPRSLLEAALILRKFRPQVVVGTGGYSSGPVLLVAAVAETPTLLIEPNSVPGFTNRLLALGVSRAVIGFEAAERYFGGKAVLTGNPVRPVFFDVGSRERSSPRAILIMGGSQGSEAINRAVVQALPMLRERISSAEFYHQTGEKDYNGVREAYARQGLSATVFPFTANLAEIFAKIDLVIARAGAITVAELAASGKASLLVPFPAATDNHQMENARAMERVGAAKVLPQSELNGERMAGEIVGLLGDPAQLDRMEAAARTLARPDAVRHIVAVIEELAKSQAHL